MKKSEVDKLFEENAVLFGFEDGIPLDVAGMLLGDDAVRFAINYKSDKRYPKVMVDYFKAKDGGMWYITREGVYIAASYLNIFNDPEKLKADYKQEIFSRYFEERA